MWNPIRALRRWASVSEVAEIAHDIDKALDVIEYEREKLIALAKRAERYFARERQREHRRPRDERPDDERDEDIMREIAQHPRRDQPPPPPPGW